VPIPLISWVIVALGIALGVILLSAHLGRAVSWIFIPLGLVGGLVGIAALYEILSRLWQKRN